MSRDAQSEWAAPLESQWAVALEKSRAHAAAWARAPVSLDERCLRVGDLVGAASHRLRAAGEEADLLAGVEGVFFAFALETRLSRAVALYFWTKNMPLSPDVSDAHVIRQLMKAYRVLAPTFSREPPA